MSNSDNIFPRFIVRMMGWYPLFPFSSDGKDQLRYAAGEDAKATVAARNQVGAEAFRIGMDQLFFGQLFQRPAVSA